MSIRRRALLLLGVACAGLSSGCNRGTAVQAETHLVSLFAETPVLVNCLRYQDFICLPVVINGHPAHLLVDTGSDGLVIREGALESLGLRRAKNRWIYTASSFNNGYIPCLEPFTLELPDIAFITSTYAPIGSDHPNAIPYVGLLGVDVLRPLGAVIDTRAGTITFPRTTNTSQER